jgi:hypothetical protein
MRNLAVSLTQRQVANSVDRLLGRPTAGPFKTVTRRDGWAKLKPGALLCLVEKGMGLKPGEQVKRLALVHVLNVRRERLDAMTVEDAALEGFNRLADFGHSGTARGTWAEILWPNILYPANTIVLPKQFIEFFCATHKGTTPATTITRIEWEYVGGPQAAEKAREWVNDGWSFSSVRHIPEAGYGGDEPGFDRYATFTKPEPLAVPGQGIGYTRTLWPDGDDRPI